MTSIIDKLLLTFDSGNILSRNIPPVPSPSGLALSDEVSVFRDVSPKIPGHFLERIPVLVTQALSLQTRPSQ